jgi:hypothetical protein
MSHWLVIGPIEDGIDGFTAEDRKEWLEDAGWQKVAITRSFLKQFKWESHQDGQFFSVGTPFGNYTIDAEDCQWRFCFDEFYDEGEFTCDSVEECKTAAWNHWVERISPMLISDDEAETNG